MASFLIPIADKQDNDIIIKKIIAQSINEAQEKIKSFIFNDYAEWDVEIDCPENYNTFKEIMLDYDIIIGDPIDIEIV